MTITLNAPYATYGTGVSVDLDNATEAALVAQGRATFVLGSAASAFAPLTAVEQQTLRDGITYRLYNSAVPIVLLSSATNISAAGAITGLTALPYTPSGVVRVFCFAQTGLAAGLYYATFSNTTSCQLFELVSSSPAVPGTTQPSGITAGAYAGGTTEATLLSVPVPGGLLGLNGRLRAAPTYSAASNNANAKTITGRLGGTLAHSFSPVTSTLSNRGVGDIQNRGLATVQVCGSGAALQNLYAGGSGVAWQQISVNTAVDQTYAISMTMAVATDSCIIEACLIEVLT